MLASLTIPDFDFRKLASSYNLLAFLGNLMTTSLAKGDSEEMNLGDDDDVLLECIILIGTMALDEAIHPLVCQTKLLDQLVSVLKSNSY